MSQAQTEFRKRIRAELGRAFLKSGRELTPETRRQFAQAALSIVAAELGRPPDEDMRGAISRWAWNLYMDDKEQLSPSKRKRAARGGDLPRSDSRVMAVEQHDTCRVYRLRFGNG